MQQVGARRKSEHRQDLAHRVRRPALRQHFGQRGQRRDHGRSRWRREEALERQAGRDVRPAYGGQRCRGRRQGEAALPVGGGGRFAGRGLAVPVAVREYGGAGQVAVDDPAGDAGYCGYGLQLGERIYLDPEGETIDARDGRDALGRVRARVGDGKPVADLVVAHREVRKRAAILQGVSSSARIDCRGRRTD